MGCCGCTLQTTAIVAAVFGIIESVAGLLGGIIFSEQIKYSRIYGVEIIRNVMISASVFNALWLGATIILIVGIIKQNAAMHRVWVGATSVIMVLDLAHTIALVVALVNVGTGSGYSYSYNSYNYHSSNVNSASSYYSGYSTSIFVFVVLMTAVTRGSIWLWIINICLTIYTAHRANEIERGGPVQQGHTILTFGQQPVQAYPGQTIVIQHGGPPTGMPPAQYGQPPAQYGQPPAAQYGQPPPQYGQTSPPYPPTDQGFPSKQ